MAKEFVKGVTVGEATAEENTQPAVSTVETNEEETKQVGLAESKHPGTGWQLHAAG